MNVRPSKEVTLHSHRHGTTTPHALRGDWPLAWNDAPRVFAVVVAVAVCAAGLALCRLVPWFDGARNADGRFSRTLMVREDTLPAIVAMFTSALGSPIWVAGALTALALRRLRRWQIWRSSLLLTVPTVLAALAVWVGHLTWRQWESAGAARPAAHAVFIVVLGSAIGLSEFDPSKRRIVAAFCLTAVMAVATGWGRIALGADRASDVAAGIAVGSTAVLVSWLLVRGAQRRHLDRALEHELPNLPGYR